MCQRCLWYLALSKDGVLPVRLIHLLLHTDPLHLISLRLSGALARTAYVVPNLSSL